MKDKYTAINVEGTPILIVQTTEPGGWFEGRSGNGMNICRSGGFLAMGVNADEAAELRDPKTPDSRRQEIIYSRFEQVKEAEHIPDSQGMLRPREGVIVNILPKLRDDIHSVTLPKLSRGGALKGIKEYDPHTHSYYEDKEGFVSSLLKAILRQRPTAN